MLTPATYYSPLQVQSFSSPAGVFMPSLEEAHWPAGPDGEFPAQAGWLPSKDVSWLHHMQLLLSSIGKVGRQERRGNWNTVRRTPKVCYSEGCDWGGAELYLRTFRERDCFPSPLRQPGGYWREKVTFLNTDNIRFTYKNIKGFLNED